MNNLRYICVQPRIQYYAWQIEVMINNFIKHGISGNDIDVLVAWNPNDDTNSSENIEMWNKLTNKYNYVRFFFYQDTREDMSYIPSIYFNILKQHIQAHPELSTQSLFLHDSDILFTKPVDFNFALNDNVWYLSDTVGYIGTQYILTKGGYTNIIENLYKGYVEEPLVEEIEISVYCNENKESQFTVPESHDTYSVLQKILDKAFDTQLGRNAQIISELLGLMEGQ